MRKKSFEIIIEETISEKFIVYANDADSAIEIANSKYDSGEFVLAPGNLIKKQMTITSVENEVIEWNEF